MLLPDETIFSLEKLLGSDNVEDIKKRISDLIVEHVQQDINDCGVYLFYPEQYTNGIIEESVERVEKKIRKMFETGLLEIAENAVERGKRAMESNIPMKSEWIFNREDWTAECPHCMYKVKWDKKSRFCPDCGCTFEV